MAGASHLIPAPPLAKPHRVWLCIILNYLLLDSSDLRIKSTGHSRRCKIWKFQTGRVVGTLTIDMEKLFE
jgi:hypothetical protein